MTGVAAVSSANCAVRGPGSPRVHVTTNPFVHRGEAGKHEHGREVGQSDKATPRPPPETHHFLDVVVRQRVVPRSVRRARRPAWSGTHTRPLSPAVSLCSDITLRRYEQVWHPRRP